MPSAWGIRFNLTKGVCPMACNMFGKIPFLMFLENSRESYQKSILFHVQTTLYLRVIVVQMRRIFLTRIFGPRTPTLFVRSEFSKVRVGIGVVAVSQLFQLGLFRSHYHRICHRAFALETKTHQTLAHKQHRQRVLSMANPIGGKGAGARFPLSIVTYSTSVRVPTIM